jgi:hypothetical protein
MSADKNTGRRSPGSNKSKKEPRAARLNLGGVKFEDALRKMLNTPPIGLAARDLKKSSR